MLKIPDTNSVKSEFLNKFSKNSKITGIVFVILGLVGIAFPMFMSVTSGILFGWLLLVSGFVALFHTLNTNKADIFGWLKSFVLIIFGALSIVNPMPGIATLGILFAIYFAMDAFASFALAFSLKGSSRWWLILINGIISVVLSFLFISSWPFGSLYYVGMFIGISLFFDGIILLSLSSATKNIGNDG